MSTIGIKRYTKKSKKNETTQKGILIKRKGARPRTKLARRLTKEEKKLSIQLDPWMHEEMPKTRAECNYGHRPCPYVRCRYNLYLEVKPNGSLQENWKFAPNEMRESCALDISEKGEHTLDQVGEYLNLTRERVRQLQRDALEKLRESGLDFAAYLEELSKGSSSMFAYMDYIKYGPGSR